MTHQEPTRRLAIPLLGLALALASCSGSGSESTGGFADLQRDHEARSALEYEAARDALVVCMLADGFDVAEIEAYIADANPAEEDSLKFESDVDSLLSIGGEEEVAARLGFGFAPVALLSVDETTDDVEEELLGETEPPPSSPASDALESAFGECASSSGYLEPAPSTREYTAVAAEIDELVRADPGSASIAADWQECMSKAGYKVANLETLHRATSIATDTMQELDPLPFSTAAAGGRDGSDSPDEARFVAVSIYGSANSWPELAALEIEAAKQEYQCRQDISHDVRMAAIRDQVTVELMEQ